MCDAVLTEKEIKKEVISQMFWEFMGIDYCMRKDLDDVCEDIYNKVFVPFLKKICKETIKEILQELKDEIKKAIYQYYNEDGGYYLAEDVLDDIDVIAYQHGVEVK